MVHVRAVVVVLVLAGAVSADPILTPLPPSRAVAPLPPYRPLLSPLPPSRGPLTPYSYSPYSGGIRTTTALTFRSPLTIGAQTTVSAPDGATVRVAGYSTASSGRNEFGAPGVGRPLRNTGYGRSLGGSTIEVRARVIILREEEERLMAGQSR